MQFAFDAPVERAGTWSSRWERYAGRDVIALWVADADFRAPPCVLQAMAARLAHGVLGYTVPPAELREAIVARMRRLYGWRIEPDWIVFLPGVVPGLHLAARARIPRLFVCYHRPAWGTGVKEDATDIQREWGPLLEKFQVDAVFEHDHHVYKRTKPLTLRRGDAVPDADDGVVYIGDGAWGVEVRSIPASAAALGYLEHWASTNHLLEVTLDGTSTRVAAIDADSATFDEVTIPLRRPR